MAKGKGSRTSPTNIEVAERRARALKLRCEGYSLEEIAEHAELAEDYRGRRAMVSQDITRALRAVIREPAEELLTLELTRLDRLLRAVWSAAMAGDPQSVDRALNIMKRRSQYLGLDAADGLAKRRAELDEQTAALMVEVITGVLGELDLGPEQSAQAQDATVRWLRAVEERAVMSEPEAS